MIPTSKKCKKLWDKYNLPKKKRIHSDIIARVAEFLAQKLEKQGIVMDHDLLIASCLLHDIDKNVPKHPKEKHPESAVRILREEGLNAIADVVRTHSLHCILNNSLVPTTWEQKVLYLADKMVKYELVGVDERFSLWRAEDLPLEINHELDKSYPKVKALEKEIFDKAATRFEEIKNDILNDSV